MSKNEKKVKSKIKKFNLADIDEMKIIMIFSSPEKESAIINKIAEYGGRVVLTAFGAGIAKRLGLQTTSTLVGIACARKEDADNILVAVDTELNFSLPGMGLGFTLDVDGYLGAKGLFV